MTKIKHHNVNVLKSLTNCIDSLNNTCGLLSNRYVGGDVFYDEKNEIVVIIRKGRLSTTVYFGLVSSSKGYVDTVRNVDVSKYLKSMMFVGNDRELSFNLNRHFHDRSKRQAQSTKPSNG